MRRRDKKHSVFGRVLSVLWTLTVFAFFAYGGYFLLSDPRSPLPREWNPTKPLRLSDPVTPLTMHKLNRALATTEGCFAVLEDALIEAPILPDLVETEQCYIKGRVRLSSIAGVKLAPVETRCAIALRTAFWTVHDLQPAAREIYGTELSRIKHFSSYNCREIRTVSGSTGRMSTHATANALDVSGFGLVASPDVSLLQGWNGSDQDQAFLRRARDSACTWFKTVLSPEYNRLHADHFHVQSVGWGGCR